MKPGALVASLVLGWILVGLLVIEAILFLIGLTNISYARGSDYLMLVGPPLLVTGLMVGCLIGLTKGSPVGRILYAVLGGLLVVLAIVVLVSTRIPTLLLISTLLEMLLLIASVICAFLPGVTAWMATRPTGYAAFSGGYQQPGYGQPNYGQQNFGHPNPGQPTGGWAAPAQAAAQPAYAPVAQPAAAAPNLRPCPHCAEPIRPEASKCRYCGSAVQPLV